MLGMLRHMASYARGKHADPHRVPGVPDKVYLIWSSRSNAELQLLDQELIDLARSVLSICHYLRMPHWAVTNCVSMSFQKAYDCLIRSALTFSMPGTASVYPMLAVHSALAWFQPCSSLPANVPYHWSPKLTAHLVIMEYFLRSSIGGFLGSTWGQMGVKLG